MKNSKVIYWIKNNENLAGTYNTKIDNKPHNAFYDRLNTPKLIGQVNDKSFLNAACGPGKYAEILISRSYGNRI